MPPAVAATSTVAAPAHRPAAAEPCSAPGPESAGSAGRSRSTAARASSVTDRYAGGTLRPAPRRRAGRPAGRADPPGPMSWRRRANAATRSRADRVSSWHAARHAVDARSLGWPEPPLRSHCGQPDADVDNQAAGAAGAPPDRRRGVQRCRRPPGARIQPGLARQLAAQAVPRRPAPRPQRSARRPAGRTPRRRSRSAGWWPGCPAPARRGYPCTEGAPPHGHRRQPDRRLRW